jgi:hypothetical protein
MKAGLQKHKNPHFCLQLLALKFQRLAAFHTPKSGNLPDPGGTSVPMAKAQEPDVPGML